jgi:hypothetical protein
LKNENAIVENITSSIKGSSGRSIAKESATVNSTDHGIEAIKI